MADKQPERYVRVRSHSVELLVEKVNELCKTEEIIHGAWYSVKPTHKLVTAFPSALEEDYIALLEKL
jgi:hypothetical protein